MTGSVEGGQLRAGAEMGDSTSTPGFPQGRRSTPAAEPEETRELQSRFIHDNLRRIFLQIFRIVGNVDDAQDLTQETFIKALQRQEQIKDLDKAAHWLSRIATNTAIDFLRRHGRVAMTEISGLSEPLTAEPEEGPERLLLRAEHSAYLHDGLQTLSERERTALVLRDVDGLSGKEVARIMTCSEATVRSHIANARIKFRRYLERKKV